ncbi:MAG TPA: HYR domain-containing protein [Lysobacter sp.]
MNRQIAAIRRGGFAVFACMALALVSAQVQAQTCTGTPNVSIDPVSQTVPKSIPGAPTTVQLKGVTNKVDPTLLWTQTLGPAVTLLPNRNVANPTFTAPSAGPVLLRFTLTASCSTGSPRSATTDINVTDVVTNAPPTALASASPANAHEGNVVTLDGTASYDIDPGTTLSYSWAQTGIGPTSPAVTLSNANPAGSIVTFVAPNTPVATGAVLTFRLTVSDGTLTGTTDQSVNIVWANDPPIASLACSAEDGSLVDGVLIVDEGDLVALDGRGSYDSDGSIVSYSWSQAVSLPYLSIGALDTASISFNAPILGYQQMGSLTLTLTVTDDVGATSDAVCSVWINDVTPPIIDVPTDKTIEADFAGGKAFSYSVMAFDAVDNQEPYELACVPGSGSDFPLAAAPANQTLTTVACSAVDSAGNPASATFNVTVEDTTSPAITVPLSFAIEAVGPDGAVGGYAATTWDAVDGAGDANCSPASGSLFAIETVLVTCNATDARGNAAAAATFEVTVHDTTAPVIAAHGGEVAEATGPGGASVSYALPSVSDAVSTSLEATCLPTSGSTFALGSHTVTCNATDAADNDATETSFQVTVQDTTAPVIAAHGSETVEATGPGGASVSYVLPAVSDAVSTGLVATCLPASGTFALGAHTVTCDATDAAGNPAVATTFQVTVQDTTAPVVAAHGSETVEATGPGGASVSYVLPAVSDAVSTGLVATCLPASGSTFALGAHTVTCDATDAAGNAAVAMTFQVTVHDNTAPVISYLGDISAIAGSNSVAVVEYPQPTADDLVDGAVDVSCSPASGSTFSAGTTAVVCTTKDSRNNTATGSFNVQVSYAFAGFFKPVDMWPVVNVAKAGSAVPLKFNLGGYQGMEAIMAEGYPKSAPMACNGVLEDPILETVNAGSSSLSYDAVGNQYIYVWKSAKSWAGTCRQLQVKLADGSVHTANFSFK